MDKSKLKNNDHKHPYLREQWIKNKRMGRPKQRWVGYTVIGGVLIDGRWEKVSA